MNYLRTSKGAKVDRLNYRLYRLMLFPQNALIQARVNTLLFELRQIDPNKHFQVDFCASLV